MEWWAVLFQYSSFTTTLFNVFNQSILAWIVTLIILDQKNLRNILFIYSTMLFNGPFPFIGLVPIVIFKIIDLVKQNEFNIDIIKKNALIQQTTIFLKNEKIISFQNLIGGGFLLLIGLSFLFLNVGNHEHGFI